MAPLPLVPIAPRAPTHGRPRPALDAHAPAIARCTLPCPRSRPMPQRLRVIGNYLSPYVRKVLVCLELKGLEYEIDPIAPFVGNDEFTRLSPLRRIPVLLDGGLVLADSSVICQY